MQEISHCIAEESIDDIRNAMKNAMDCPFQIQQILHARTTMLLLEHEQRGVFDHYDDIKCHYAEIEDLLNKQSSNTTIYKPKPKVFDQQDLLEWRKFLRVLLDAYN